MFAAVTAFSLYFSGGAFFCSEALQAEAELAEGGNVFFQGRVQNIVQKEEQTVISLGKGKLWRDKKNSEVLSCQGLLVYINNQQEDCQKYSIGKTLTGQGSLQKIEKPGNPGQFDARNYYYGKAVDYRIFSGSILKWEGKADWYQEALRKLREILEEGIRIVFPKEDQGMLESMLLGDKEQMDTEIYNLYQLAGIAHLLAISGLHMGLAGRGLYGLLRKMGASFFLSFFLSLLLLISYGLLTGMGASALRALIMFGLAMFAKVCGRSNDLLTSASVALVLMVIANPWYLTQSGVWLSFGAVFAIGGLCPRLTTFFRPKHTIGKSLIVSFGVQIFTVPILCYSFFQFSLYSIILNLLVIPLMTVVFVSGFAGAFLGLVLPVLGKMAGGPAHYVLRLYEGLAEFFAKLPGNMVLTGKPALWQIGAYYGILWLLLFFVPWMVKRRRRKKKEAKRENDQMDKRQAVKNGILQRWFGKLALVLGLLLLPQILCYHEPAGLCITMLDVGQGDGIYLKTPEGRSAFVDGGSSDVKEVGAYRLLPFLKASRRKSVDVWIITHGDSDHYSGFLEVLEQVKKGEFSVDALWLPDVANPGEGYRKLEEEAKKLEIPIAKVSAGEVWQEKGLTLTSLNPKKGYVSESENAYSLTFLLEYGKFRGLFTGDVEKGGEEAVKKALQEKNASGGLERLTLLKVAHHGSSNSTTEAFCQNLKADFAWISVGAENSYGHPAKEVTERLEKMGAQIDKTMESGALSLITDGETLEIRRYREK